MGRASRHLTVMVASAPLLGACEATIDRRDHLSLDLGEGVTLEFVRIEPGEFMMGSSATEQSPAHHVSISEPFWMGVSEVTNAQFRRFRPGFDSNDPRGGANIAYQQYIRGLNPEFNGDEQPAVYVGWDAAVAFTDWLSAQTGLAVRLPTESEWEFACRAGSTSAYSWGDDPERAHMYANTNDPVTAETFRLRDPFPNDDGFRATAPVRSFAPNGFGLYDMHGNVAEWTMDPWHEDYQGAPGDRRVWENPAEIRRRVTRGGSFESSPGGVHFFACTCAGRSWNYRGNHNFGTGFRVVVGVDASDPDQR